MNCKKWHCGVHSGGRIKSYSICGCHMRSSICFSLAVWHITADTTARSGLTFLSITEKQNTLVKGLIYLLQRLFITDSLQSDATDMNQWDKSPPTFHCPCSPLLLLFYNIAIRHVQHISETLYSIYVQHSQNFSVPCFKEKLHNYFCGQQSHNVSWCKLLFLFLT